MRTRLWFTREQASSPSRPAVRTPTAWLGIASFSSKTASTSSSLPFLTTPTRAREPRIDGGGWHLEQSSTGPARLPHESQFNSIQKRVHDSYTGFSYDDPVPSGRERPDGTVLKWSIGAATTPSGGPIPPCELPFWCLDRTPRELRVPYEKDKEMTQHPCGAVGVSRLVLDLPKDAVGKLDATYAAVFGSSSAQVQDSTRHFSVPSGFRHADDVPGGRLPPPRLYQHDSAPTTSILAGWPWFATTQIIFKHIMGDRNRTESSPLLGDVTDNGAARVDEPNKPSGADATRAQFLRVVIPGSLIVACFGFASQFLSIGLSEIMEGSICQREYGNVTSPYADPRCKNEAVQTRLATVKGWEQTFSLLPGLLLAVPYGMVADRYGPKFVLCLIWIGDILSQIGESAVCLCPNVFHMAWIYPFSMLSAIGGGAIGYAAMSYLVAGSITSVENRSTMFFYMNAIMIAASFASGPAGYFAMEISPVFTMALGIGGLAIQLLLTLFLPSKLPGHTAPNNIDIEFERTEGVVRHAMNTLKQVALMFRALFWEDLHVALLFCSIMLTTLGGWEAIIRLQYATKRYDWSWGEAGLLASVKAVANFAGVALILPAISQFLLKKGSFSAVRKDMWLLRISIVAQVFGSVLSAVAPTGKAFVAAVSIFELSKGYLPAALSVVATLVDDKHQSLVYVTSSIMQALGSIVAGPLLAETFNLGLKWGRAWYGLPFAFAGLLQLVAAVIVFASRQRKRNESHA